nr:YetF domain-containing protein [Bacillus sp. NTK071]
MGKSTIIQMTPYDLVAIIIVGTVASEPLISTEFWPTIYALAILVLFHILFSKLTLWQVGNHFFLGEPTILVKHGEIIEDNLEKSRLSVAQLLSILRSKGYPKISDIDYAMLEPIGEVSIIPKVENTPVTVQHLEISIDDEGLPISVVIDGKIQMKNLKLLGKSKGWLIDQLQAQDLLIKDIIYAYVNEKTKKLNINKRG